MANHFKKKLLLSVIYIFANVGSGAMNHLEISGNSVTEEEYAIGCLSGGYMIASYIDTAKSSIDPLRLAATYSLEVGDRNSGTKSGYFPIGFVHGDPEQRTLLGACHEQDSQNNSGFTGGGSGRIPINKSNPYGTRFFSVAWANAALTSAMQNKPALDTKYGLIKSQIDVDGRLPKRLKPNFYQSSTRKYLMDYTRMHVASRVASPIFNSIVHWGGDNEWEGSPDYSNEARKAFKNWLENSYNNNIRELNEAWRCEYKNFKNAAFGPLPSENQYSENPGKFLDFWTFQSDYFSALLADMGKTMYMADPLHRGFMYKSTQQTIEMPVVNRARTFSPERFADLIRPYSGGLYGCDIYGSGDRQVYEVNDLYNSIRPIDKSRGYGVFLAEFNNHSGPGHQFASTAWRLLANGLKGSDLFTMGWVGATQDWDHFGFIDAKSGEPKDKLFYAARWIHTIQRSEAFWTDCIPALGVPRVAILMPRRDVLLADPKTNNRWAYPENHRWMVFRWLREQGYWIDIIPVTKLDDAYLSDYQGLFLIGAEHLTASESHAVTSFVKNGGILVADTRPGYYDDHHRVRKQLESLCGVTIDRFAGKEAFILNPISVRGRGIVSVHATTASKIRTWGETSAYLNKEGKGKVLYLSFALGTLTEYNARGIRPDFTPDGPTAESEEYVAGEREFAIGDWLGSLLKTVGLMPAYRQSKSEPSVMGKIRVEQPMVDQRGNIAVIITNRAQNLGPNQEPGPEGIPDFNVEMPLPTNEKWTDALWSAAEGDGFVRVPVNMNAGNYIVRIPAILTGGILYFFKNHSPLMGIKIAGNGLRSAADGHSLKVKAGQTFNVTVSVFNTTGKVLENGKVRLQALSGWKVVPSELVSGPLQAGKDTSFKFTVTPPSGDLALKPDWLYPLVAHWNNGQKDISVSSASVIADITPANGMRLLSDNKGFPAGYPFLLLTGASYHYEKIPDEAVQDPLAKDAFPNTALQAGRIFSGIGASRVAAFESKSADIVFDLKKKYEVARVSVLRDGNILPILFTVQISEDGINYKTISSQAFTEGVPASSKLESGALTAKGRYVRLHVEWANEGGKLSNVEIWGR